MSTLAVVLIAMALSVFIGFRTLRKVYLPPHQSAYVVPERVRATRSVRTR